MPTPEIDESLSLHFMRINVEDRPPSLYYLTSIDLFLPNFAYLALLCYQSANIMKFAITALFAGIAAAAPAATTNAFETVTISNFVYVGVNGYPQISYHIHSQHVDNVHCGADPVEVGGVYSCDDPSYTFKILEEQGHYLTLTHVLNG